MQNRETKQFVIGLGIIAALFLASLFFVSGRIRHSPTVSTAQRAVQKKLKLEVEQALQRYFENCKVYPNTDPGLVLLVQRETDAECPSLKQALLPRFPRDAWGNPYFYHRTREGYALQSWGRDGKPGGQGDDQDL